MTQPPDRPIEYRNQRLWRLAARWHAWRHLHEVKFHRTMWDQGWAACSDCEIHWYRSLS